MSDLVAIAYPDEGAVTRATANLAEAIREGLIEVEDVVVIVRDEDGTVDVRQGSTGVGAAAGGGAMWGGLIGLIFLAPLLGMAVGALAGGAAWKSMFGEAGVAESFVDELRESLTPGSAALVLLVREMAPTSFSRRFASTDASSRLRLATRSKHSSPRRWRRRAPEETRTDGLPDPRSRRRKGPAGRQVGPKEGVTPAY
jgi:uncharacterized membrane protein